ncbi:MAG: mechanosensitive ion channel family protein [Firmicutes bacterium]|nr:mechanosensitive ion channel family protein [Bacillota bacterium]
MMFSHIGENLAKNEAEYLLKKRRSKIKRIIAFVIFSAVVLSVYVVALILNAVFDSNSLVARTVRTNILENNGHPIVQTIIFICLGFIIITLAHFFIRLLGIKGHKRRKTIVAITASFVKYIGYIVLLVIIFNVWSLDTAILAAVIAAFGIALGFGAQGLVSDLLTGLFLIFENSLQVGDIISFKDYRGEVEEIGIRTTKIRHNNGNVKVINNSQLKVFVNMSIHRSLAMCDFTIEYGENIERVEKVISGHFAVVAEKYPVITEGPIYKGLVKFDEKGVVLKIIAKCLESERLQLERDLNREFKMLFDKNKIKLAVPKVELVT